MAQSSRFETESDNRHYHCISIWANRRSAFTSRDTEMTAPVSSAAKVEA